MKRRNFLKSTAIAAGATLGPQLATAKKGPGTKRLRGNAANPITVGDIHELRMNLVHEFERRGGSVARPLPMSDPGVEDGFDIVDYVVTLGPNGKPRQHIETVATGQSVDNARGRAANAKRRFEQSGRLSTQDDLSTQEISGWEYETSDEYYSEYAPYGVIYSNYDWRKLKEGNDDYDEDMHGFHQYSGMVPGSSKDGSEYDGSDWMNQVGWAYQNWNHGNASGRQLHSRGPVVQETPYNVSIGLPSFEFTYDFPSDTDIVEQGEPSEGRGEWKYDIWGSTNRHNPNEIQPGSSCRVDEKSSGTQLDIVRLKTTGQFQNDVDLSRVKWSCWMDTWWNF